jgi:hypothetical protein
MKTKTLGQLAAAFAVGWAVSASAPVLAGMTVDASALTSPLRSCETDRDRDDADQPRKLHQGDRFFALQRILPSGFLQDTVGVLGVGLDTRLHLKHRALVHD